MARTFVTALVSGAIGFAAGAAFWYLASPLWIDDVVAEDLPVELMTSVVRSGAFSGADSAHQGSGRALLLETAGGASILRFEAFEVTNGPDLEVWLAVNRDIARAADVTDGGYVSLGRLKGNIGEQNYVLPPEIDASAYGAAVIWCEQFDVLFASAPLD